MKNTGKSIDLHCIHTIFSHLLNFLTSWVSRLLVNAIWTPFLSPWMRLTAPDCAWLRLTAREGSFCSVRTSFRRIRTSFWRLRTSFRRRKTSSWSLETAFGCFVASASGGFFRPQVVFLLEMYRFFTEHLSKTVFFARKARILIVPWEPGRKKKRTKNHRKRIRLSRVMNISSFHKKFVLSAHYKL